VQKTLRAGHKHSPKDARKVRWQYWRTQRTVVQGSWGSKLDAIVRYLLYLRVHEPDAKSLVFSQWDDVLK